MRKGLYKIGFRHLFWFEDYKPVVLFCETVGSSFNLPVHPSPASWHDEVLPLRPIRPSHPDPWGRRFGDERGREGGSQQTGERVLGHVLRVKLLVVRRSGIIVACRFIVLNLETQWEPLADPLPLHRGGGSFILPLSMTVLKKTTNRGSTSVWLKHDKTTINKMVHYRLTKIFSKYSHIKWCPKNYWSSTFVLYVGLR